MKRALILAVLLAALGLSSTSAADISGGRSITTTEYTAILAVTTTSTGQWYDTSNGEWDCGSITITGLTGAGATIFVDYCGSTASFDESGSATAPLYYEPCAQYGAAIVANGSYELPMLARFIKFRVEDYTAGTVLGIARLTRK